MISSETGRNGGVSLTVPHPVPRRGAPASDMWRNARTCARMPEPQPVLGDLAGFCALTGTSYHRNDLKRLNAIFRVKFGNIIFFSYLCSPISKTVEL